MRYGMKAAAAPVMLLMALLAMYSSQAVTDASTNVEIGKYTQIVELTATDSLHRIDIIVNAFSAASEITLALPPRVRELAVSIDGNPQNGCRLEEKEGYALLECPFPQPVTGRHSISLRYATSYPLYPLRDRIVYRSEYRPSYPTQELVYIIKLPPGAIIPEEKEASFFMSPPADQIYSDGRRIILRWDRNGLGEGSEPFDISVMMKPLQKSTPWAWIAGAVLIVLAGWYIFRRKKRGSAGKPSGEYAAHTALLPEEQKVVEIIKNHLKESGDGIWQKQLQLQSGLSKVKVSRILQRLEKRGVVRKEEWGNTNKVYLADGSVKNIVAEGADAESVTEHKDVTEKS